MGIHGIWVYHEDKFDKFNKNKKTKTEKDKFGGDSWEWVWYEQSLGFVSHGI